jgi:diguanylate cyclase (GGDEF)-like protein
VVADRLRSRLRRKDLIARRAADQFLVALPDLAPASATEEATRLAVALADAVALPVGVHGHDLALGASVGVALFPGDGADVPALLRAADRRRTAGKPAPQA